MIRRIPMSAFMVAAMAFMVLSWAVTLTVVISPFMYGAVILIFYIIGRMDGEDIEREKNA